MRNSSYKKQTEPSTDYKIYETTEYIEKFLENLLLSREHKLSNRKMLLRHLVQAKYLGEQMQVL